MPATQTQTQVSQTTNPVQQQAGNPAPNPTGAGNPAGQPGMINADKKSMPRWLWWLIGALGAVVVILLIYFFLF